MSRIADNRVGYFLTAQKDFSKDAREQTVFNRYINRWHLEKQDNSLRMSPPKEPIVIYIEKTVPVRAMPACTSSAMNTMPFARHHSASAGR